MHRNNNRKQSLQSLQLFKIPVPLGEFLQILCRVFGYPVGTKEHKESDVVSNNSTNDNRNSEKHLENTSRILPVGGRGSLESDAYTFLSAPRTDQLLFSSQPC